MTDHISPAAAATIRKAERLRLTSFLDKRISEWELFAEEFPDHPGLDILLAELDYIRSVIDVSKHPNRR